MNNVYYIKLYYFIILEYLAEISKKFWVSRKQILLNRTTIFINYIATSSTNSHLIEFVFGHDEVYRVSSKQCVSQYSGLLLMSVWSDATPQEDFLAAVRSQTACKRRQHKVQRICRSPIRWWGEEVLHFVAALLYLGTNREFGWARQSLWLRSLSTNIIMYRMYWMSSLAIAHLWNALLKNFLNVRSWSFLGKNFSYATLSFSYKTFFNIELNSAIEFSEREKSITW